MTTEAYKQGMAAKSYKDNPHKLGTQDHEDFNAGFSQRIRRGFTPREQNRIQWGHMESHENSISGSRVISNTIPPKENSYAKARGK